MNCVTIDPSNPQILYASTLGGGIFKSANSGASWASSSSGMTDDYAYCLIVNPSNPQILYAGTEHGGVFKSTDGGASWTTSCTGLTNSDIRSLAIDPLNTQTLYAGAWSGGVYKSTDGGASWSYSGLTSLTVYCLAIDSVNPQTIYAGTWNRLWTSSNGGASWNSSSAGLTSGYVFSLAFDSNNPQILYAGAGCGGGVWKSTNGGVSWANSGLANIDVESLVVNPSNPQILYAGTAGDEVFRSSDGGASWNSSSTGMTNGWVQSLVIDPFNPQTLYASTRGGGILKSTNGGASWSSSSNGMTSREVWYLVIDPSNPQILYAGCGEDSGVFKSTDGGASWVASYNGLARRYMYSLTIDPSNSQVLYAIANDGVFKSTNGGASWTASSTGLTTSWGTCLAIDPLNSQTLYAGTEGGGVFKSTDGGASWSSSSTGLTGSVVRSLDFDQIDSQILYAGTWDGGVFKSINGGVSWSSSSNGMTYRDVWCLAIDPNNSQILYAGTGCGGVFKSSDGGTSWSYDGLPHGHVYSLAFDLVNSQILYAGTGGGGVFKYIPFNASSLSLVSPNGGEQWGLGSTHAITWWPTNLSGNVIIQLSRDGGSTYPETIAASVPVSAGSYSWFVTEPVSISCRVRVTSISDPSDFDTSDKYFIISTSPSIAFTPSSFTFSCTRGQANPSPQTLEIWNVGGGTLNWTANEGAGWLSLAPTAGSSTGEHDPVMVSVDASGLVAGTYTATITLAATGADNSPQQFPVNLTVQEPLPSIAFTPSSFTFSCTRGQANPSPQTLEVWNVGGGTLNWTANEGAGWLSLAPTAGSSTGEHDPVTVSVDASGLVAGTYTATISLTTVGADNSPQQIPIALTVHESLPSIGFSPSSFTFSCTRGKPNPPLQTLEVWNSGGGTLNWTASEGVGWLSLAPTSGSSIGEHDPITLSVDASSLSAGTYTATITLAAVGADNSPQSVGVTLTVHEPLPSIAFTPTSFTFTCTRGQANPSPQTLEVWNVGGGTLNWTANEGAGWLSLAPTAGSSTGEHDPVMVSVDASGLVAGTYTATITLTAVGADNSPQSVGVMLVVADLSTRTVTYTLQANWNMISLPVVSTPANPSVIFSGLPPGWVIYAWDAANGRYISKEQIVLGLTAGYWLKVSTPVSYPVTGQPNGTAQTGIDLGLGWNLIGVPYEGVIPWGAVRASKDGGALVTLDDAIASNWIQNTFYRWQGNAYQGLTTGGIFQPLSGYWAKTKVTGVRLVFMKP